MAELSDDPIYLDASPRWTLRIGDRAVRFDTDGGLYLAIDMATAYLAEQHGIEVQWGRRDEQGRYPVVSRRQFAGHLHDGAQNLLNAVTLPELSRG